MERDDYDRILRTSAERVAIAAEGRLDQPVPSCPGWTAADLLAHLTVVISFWRAIADGGEEPPTDWVSPERPAGGEIVDWYRAEVRAGADAVGSLDPATTRWTWSHDQTAAFIQRRMAQEFAVHAWDAENAAGTAAAIEPAVGADGIDEYLDVFVSSNEACLAGAPLTVHLHTTDTEGEWMVTIGDGQHRLERAHGKGDVAVRAPAGDLLLWLWGRRESGDPGFETFGAADVLADASARLRP